MKKSLSGKRCAPRLSILDARSNSLLTHCVKADDCFTSGRGAVADLACSMRAKFLRHSAHRLNSCKASLPGARPRCIAAWKAQKTRGVTARWQLIDAA